MKPVSDILRSMQLSTNALGALVDYIPTELHTPIDEQSTCKPLTLRDEEGRRIYERTLRFVMLLAVKHLYPGQRIRIEYSAGYGTYVRLPGFPMTEPILSAIEAEMQHIISAGLPIDKVSWPVEKAIRYFTREGQRDKASLLRYRPKNTITMYHATWYNTELWEYFYGIMTPSTAFVRVFSLALQDEGFILYMPAPDDPEHPAPAANRPRLLRVFKQSADWCHILKVDNVADLCRMAKEKEYRRFIRINEVLHDQAISDIARDILRHGSHVVMVAGPSSSGKTTFAGRLSIHLQALGHTSYRISLDDYYLNRDTLPKEADGSVDLEAITTLDLPLLREHIAALSQGHEVIIPRFNFKCGRREDAGMPLSLKPGEIVIIEGIHGLNPSLTEGMRQDTVYRVYVSALTCLNLDDHNRIRTTDVRLLRRIVRDYLYRGTTPAQTLGMWASVRSGEEKWIFPYQENADSMFNTALHYELPILSHYAKPLLQEIDPSTEGYTIACRLRKMLNYMPEIDQDILREIPPLSLLREFIGGCTIEES